ncbi:FHA domain-containing protein [Streptomyces sp. DSM 44917]|uniref:FHA domain-containing protein n=1 Tax=Streptomyces boetiae TaxID=3075541 RepID=A0ABU2LEQ0_9ACTN|nr:FHA domain-containing protein [Streptomyces sp. DSM 44917]MDT0310002.1 FHA domain-containing protein [Streptomyces sp. DSM 44917]
MQIRLTVLGHDGAEDTDVQVAAPADTPLAAVLGSLASAAAPGSPAPGAVFCEETRLDPRLAVLGRPPLTDGAVLSFHRPAEGTGREPAGARLLVVAGPDAGGVHLLRGGPARLGRSARADVPLDDPDVSRLHCAIELTADGSVTVTDLGSTNGTLLDGAPVTGGPHPVRPGALLRLGESVLRVESEAAPAPPPPGDRDRSGRRGLAGWALGLRGASAPGAPAAPEAGPSGSREAASRWPDPAAVLLTALESGPRLWERDAGHPDAFALRLGTAQQAPELLPPVTLALPAAGSLGVAGPRGRAVGVARSLLAQLAALHPPAALEIVAVAPGRAEEWSWLGWLPHVRPSRGQDCGLLLAFDAAQAAARVGELQARVAAGPPGDGRRTVVLVDGDPGEAATRAALARLAAEGPAAGVHLLVPAETPPATAASPLEETLVSARAASPVFAGCATAAVLSGPVATALRLVGPGGAASPTAGADAVSAAWAGRFARALAPLGQDPAAGGAPAPGGGPLPESCRLLDALGLARVTPGALRERWSGQSGLPLVLGAGQDGPAALDLAAAPGPLAVDGGPRSGRTELLASLTASLAAAQGPRDLSLLLVEGAGEGLRPAAELPHVASYLPATDPVRMRAFAQALREELRRRAALLGEADGGAEPFGAARLRVARVVAPREPGDARPEAPPMRAQGSGPLPWLVVLVDDFEALLAPPLSAPGRQAAGSVVRALDAVAREGHPLGVRLITAGGAPAAAIRIALTGHPAGRAELRHATGRATHFQAGRVTARIPRTSTLRPTVARLDWSRAGDPPARRPVRELGNGPTDIALLASAATRAAETDRTATATFV